MSNLEDFGVYSRRSGESQRAFAAYAVYRDMGPQRSVARVSQKLGKSTAFLSRWSARWGWVQRAAAYDADLAAKEKTAKEYALKAEAEKWAERRIAAKEDEWQKAEALDKKVEQMLQFPLQTVEHKETEELPDGKTLVKVTVIKPARWLLRDAAALALAADQLRRRSVGLDEGHGQEEGDTSGLPENIEEIRAKRWRDAMPALLALMETKRAETERAAKALDEPEVKEVQ